MGGIRTLRARATALERRAAQPHLRPFRERRQVIRMGNFSHFQQQVGRGDPDRDLGELAAHCVEEAIKPFPSIAIGDDQRRSRDVRESPAPLAVSPLMGEKIGKREQRMVPEDRLDAVSGERRDELWRNIIALRQDDAVADIAQR